MTSPAPRASQTLGNLDSTAILVDGKLVQPSRTVDATRELPDALSAGRIVDALAPRLVAPDQGATLSAAALTETGELVAMENPPPDSRTGNIGQVSVGTLDAAGTFRPFPRASAPGLAPAVPRQAEAFDVAERTLAWAETPSTDLQYDDWSVFVADLSSGQAHPLASSQDVLPNDNLPIIGPYLNVTVGTSMVYWGTPVPRGDRGADGHYSDFQLDIVGRAIDRSGALVTVARGAILPASMGACVAYVRVHGTDPGVPEGRFVIARTCPGAPEQVLATGSLGPTGQLSSLAADAEHVAWSTWAVDDNQEVVNSDIVVLDTSLGTTTVVNVGSRIVVHLSVDASLLHWTTDGSSSVVELADGSAWSLPSVAGYYTLVRTGTQFGWFSTAPDGTSVVFNRGSLGRALGRVSHLRGQVMQAAGAAAVTQMRSGGRRCHGLATAAPG